MTAFIQPGNLADALFAFSRNSTGAMPTLPKSMARIKVRLQHLGYKKPIKKVGTTSARNTKFDCKELGGIVTVEQYFLKSKLLIILDMIMAPDTMFPEYNIKLKYPADLPVIDVAGSNVPAGRKHQPVWIPAELCIIESGQPYGKLNDRETAQMIRYACNPPRANAEAIVNQGFPALGLAPVRAPIDGFGVSIDTEMAVIPARELRSPELTYKVGKPSVRDGSWNILDVKFHRGARVTSWWVMVVRDGLQMVSGPQDPNLSGLVEGFAAKCRRSGITMPDGRPRLIPINLPAPQPDPLRSDAINKIRTTIKNALAEKPQKPSFILVLLENRDNFIYPAIKVCFISLCEVSHKLTPTMSAYR